MVWETCLDGVLFSIPGYVLLVVQKQYLVCWWNYERIFPTDLCLLLWPACRLEKAPSFYLNVRVTIGSYDSDIVLHVPQPIGVTLTLNNVFCRTSSWEPKWAWFWFGPAPSKHHRRRGMGKKNTTYRKTSSINRTKSQNLNVSCIPLQLSSLNPMKPCVKLRMKM